MRITAKSVLNEKRMVEEMLSKVDDGWIAENKMVNDEGKEEEENKKRRRDEKKVRRRIVESAMAIFCCFICLFFTIWIIVLISLAIGKQQYDNNKKYI